jgi:4-hydroxybenzoate polyprenyltransferase
MQTFRLVFRMVRWRVAPTLILFLMIGAASSGPLTNPQILRALIAVAGLLCSYACATSVNDLADFEIDKINLAGDADRPLVVGAANRGQLMGSAVLAAGLALGFAALLSPAVLAFMAFSLVINILYSLPPIEVSHRTLIAPIYLPLGYVMAPFGLGFFAVGGHNIWTNSWLLLGLYLVFIGRIILKDFRDRKGDAAEGKITFVLKYGKPTTIAVSSIVVILGMSIIIDRLYLLVGPISLTSIMLLSASLFMLWRLAKVSAMHDEQLSIGVGAKMGNGILLLVMSQLFLVGFPDHTVILIVTGLITVTYIVNFVQFNRNPADATIAYKRAKS